MRCVCYGFAAAGDGKPLVIDRQTTLRYVLGKGSTLVSTDPAATIANVTSLPAAGQLQNVIAAWSNTTSASIVVPVAFQLKAGETIFLSYGGAGCICLFFDDSTAEMP